MEQEKKKKLPQKREKRYMTREDWVTISHIFTSNKITFDIHEWRVLAWIMGRMQMKVGYRYAFPEDLQPMYHSLEKILFSGEGGKVIEVRMPLNFVLARNEKTGEVTTNRQIAKDTFESLMHKGIKFENWDNAERVFNDNKRHYIAAHIPVILSYEIYKENNVNYVNFLVHNIFWNALLDFSKGARTFELSTLLQLHKSSSIKFYMEISRQQHDIVRPVSWLREWLGVEKGQYEDLQDLVKRLIKPAKDELDKVSPFTFDFKKLGEEVQPEMRIRGKHYIEVYDNSLKRKRFYKSPRGAGNTVEFICITPKYQPEKNPNVDKRLEQFWRENYKFSDLNQEEIYEIGKFGLTEKTIYQYLDLIVGCKHLINGLCNSNWRNEDGFLSWLGGVFEPMRKDIGKGQTVNGVGYLVSSLRKHIKASGYELKQPT